MGTDDNPPEEEAESAPEEGSEASGFIAEPLSLYFDIEKGKNVDIEVISRFSLAFAAALKEAAYIADPSLEIRIELVNSDEGSLWLNSIIKSLEGVMYFY